MVFFDNQEPHTDKDLILPFGKEVYSLSNAKKKLEKEINTG